MATSNNTPIDKLDIRLISDAPAEKDNFGHKLVADALEDIITKEIGGKTIGLEGPWGSGKSTVIRLLTQQLKGRLEYNVVVFDAWAHEGDPLRRSFLETVIDAFKNRKWIDSDKWTSKQDELARRKKITESWTTPKLTSFAVVIGGLLLLSPIANALVSAALRAEFLDHTTIYSTILKWIGVSVLLAPFCLGGWLYYKKKDNAFALLLNRTDTHQRSEVIESPEPTSIEFEKIFIDLMKDGLKNNNKLLLVVDNLDRIAPQHALDIWSTLRSFLEYRDNGILDCLKNIWIVIPYDSYGLANIWEKGNEDGKGQLAQSFLDKVFQVRLFVPPPVLSDWKHYFLEQIQYAFPSVPRETTVQIYVLYERHMRAKRAENVQAPESIGTVSPTPRDIKLFINGLGAVYRQWQGHQEFPLTHLALFYLLRLGGTERVINTIETKSLSYEEISLVGNDIYDSLAGLTYNVGIKRGRQIRLKQPILDALSAPSTERILEIASNSEGYFEVLEGELYSVLDTWANAQTENIAIAAKNLVESKIINPSNLEHEHVVKLFWNAVNKTTAFRSFNKAVAEGIVALSEMNFNEGSFIELVRKIPPLEQCQRRR